MTRAKKKPGPTPASQWTAGDRIGKMTSAILREHRMNALIKSVVDVDVFIEVVEALEEAIDATAEAEISDSFLSVEELPEAIRAIEKDRLAEYDRRVDDERAADEHYDDLVKHQDTVDSEHAEKVQDLEKEIDALRARAETAEAATGSAEAVRELELLREGAAKRSKDDLAVITELRDENEKLAKEFASLSRMIELMRTKAPVKARRKKS